MLFHRKSGLFPIAITTLLMTFFIVLGFVLWPKASPPEERIENLSDPLSCPEQTLAAKMKAADLILEGQVMAVLYDNPYLDVRVLPLRVYKGIPPVAGVRILARRLAEITAETDGLVTTKDLHFSSNDKPYLLFLQETPDGRFVTRRCFGSRLVGPGLQPEEVTLLGTGASAR